MSNREIDRKVRHQAQSKPKFVQELPEESSGKNGDIVYCPRQDALFLILDNPKINYPVFYIGKVTEGLEELSTLRNGVMCKIELKDIS